MHTGSAGSGQVGSMHIHTCELVSVSAAIQTRGVCMSHEGSSSERNCMI